MKIRIPAPSAEHDDVETMVLLFVHRHEIETANDNRKRPRLVPMAR